MKIPILLLLFIIFLAVTSFKRNQQTKLQKNVTETFLEQERAANSTRRKDISSLDYIHLSLESLPMGNYQDDTLVDCENILSSLTGRKIINLSDKSNTELKTLYGPANLDILTEFDENFTLLAKTLISYASREEELGRFPEAIAILEYGMSIQSDISLNYFQLAALYQDNGCPEKLASIGTALDSMNENFAASIKEKLYNESTNPSAHIC